MPALPCRHTLAAGLLVVAPLVLFVALPGALPAQTILTVSPQQCVWRAGDDPAWAAPSLDESSWLPYSDWKPAPGQTHMWIRCHADLGPLRNLAQPALQLQMYSAYQVYLDGQLLGGSGNLRSGDFSLNAIRSFPVAGAQPPSGPSTIALRVTPRSLISNSSPILTLLEARMELRAGDAPMLDALRARAVLSRSFRYAEPAACDSIVGVIAIMLFGLFLYDRSRRELLLLSISCLSLAILRVNEFCAASLMGFSFTLCLTLVLVGNIALTYSQAPFFFLLVRRRMPMFFRIVLVIVAVPYLPSLADILLALHQPAWLGTLNVRGRPVALITHMTLSLAPFVAFWPYNGIAKRMRPLAVLCMLWGLADLVWYSVETTEYGTLPLPNLFAYWGPTLIEMRAVTTAGVLAALLGLLFREQRQVTQERAMLEGEMRAARAVQQVIIPDALPSVPNFAIESVYKPAGEVGGDFFQILPTSSGGVLIVIGDVSGKGMPAAMTVSLLVGTVRTLAHYTQNPGEILAAMNTRMLGRQQGGFTTCLVLRADPDGSLTVANAGHLAPYLDGSELKIENGLPLGLDPSAAYPEAESKLPPGARLTLISDGVAEARNKSGELFGFDRTRQISSQPADSIASAAQRFGQEDDITVLTLTLVPAAVSHA